MNRPNIWFGGVIIHDEHLIEQEIEYVYKSIRQDKKSLGREIYTLKFPDFPFSESIKQVLDGFLKKVEEEGGT